MVSQELIIELGNILQEDFGLILPHSALTKTANFLVSFFETLIEYEYEHNLSRNH